MRKRLIHKYSREESSEGVLLRSFREIRVEAIPNWSAQALEVNLLFVFDGHRLPSTEEPPEPEAEIRKWYEVKVRTASEIADKIRACDEGETSAWLWQRLAEAWEGTTRPQGVIHAVSIELINSDELQR